MSRMFATAVAALTFAAGFAGSVAAGSFEDGVVAYQRGDYATAMRLWRPLADQGNIDAQNNVGAIYATGHGAVQDYAEAVKWYRKAADQGNVDAQHNIGVMYQNGRGVKKDHAEAVKWYRKAADQGNIAASSKLAAMYVDGEGVQQNFAEAARWFDKAQDYLEAAKWYRKAADQGNAEAQDNLNKLYARFPALRERLAEQEPKRIAAETKVAVNVASPIMPEPEKLLIAAVQRARATFAAGANEMAQGAARPARAKEICAVLKDFRVSKWLGEVETLSSNSDGFGVLSIQIADGISIKTWSNALSDAVAKTLIDPESKVFKQAVVLTKGQKITFGGQFIPDRTDCIREGSLTLKGSLTQPEFIFRFSDLTAFE